MWAQPVSRAQPARAPPHRPPHLPACGAHRGPPRQTPSYRAQALQQPVPAGRGASWPVRLAGHAVHRQPLRCRAARFAQQHRAAKRVTQTQQHPAQAGVAHASASPHRPCAPWVSARRPGGAAGASVLRSPQDRCQTPVLPAHASAASPQACQLRYARAHRLPLHPHRLHHPRCATPMPRAAGVHRPAHRPQRKHPHHPLQRHLQAPPALAHRRARPDAATSATGPHSRSCKHVQRQVVVHLGGMPQWRIRIEQQCQHRQCQ